MYKGCFFLLCFLIADVFLWSWTTDIYQQNYVRDHLFSKESRMFHSYTESNQRITNYICTIFGLPSHNGDWWDLSPFLESFQHQVENIVSFANHNLPIGFPLHGKNTVVSPFGFRLDPIVFETALHTGVDLEATWKQPVFSTTDGWIQSSLSDPAYGINIHILHKSGFATIYAHLSSKVPLKIGSYIKKGVLIGYSGSTGRSNGVHLHYEIRTGEEYLNPEDYFNLGKNLSFS